MRAGKEVFGNLPASSCRPSSGGGSNTNDGGNALLPVSPVSFSPTISIGYPSLFDHICMYQYISECCHSPCEKTESWLPAWVDSTSAAASSANLSRRIKRLQSESARACNQKPQTLAIKNIKSLHLTTITSLAIFSLQVLVSFLKPHLLTTYSLIYHVP